MNNADEIDRLRMIIERLTIERDEAQNEFKVALDVHLKMHAKFMRLERAYNSLATTVTEMYTDNIKGDFQLPRLARIDLDSCMACIERDALEVKND
jgi:hypothetical protein